MPYGEERFPIGFPDPSLGSSAGRKSPSFRHNLHRDPSGHVSGYHMAVVAGVVFFVLRALFALMPAFASRHPIKN